MLFNLDFIEFNFKNEVNNFDTWGIQLNTSSPSKFRPLSLGKLISFNYSIETQNTNKPPSYPSRSKSGSKTDVPKPNAFKRPKSRRSKCLPSRPPGLHISTAQGPHITYTSTSNTAPRPFFTIRIHSARSWAGTRRWPPILCRPPCPRDRHLQRGLI